MKKQLTIRSKITLWYSILVVGIVTALICYTYFAMTNMMTDMEEQAIMDDSKRGLSTIHYSGGALSVDEAHIDMDIIFALYDAEGEMVFSNIPKSVALSSDFHYEYIKADNVGNNTWYVYDSEVINDGQKIGSIRVIRRQSFYNEILYQFLFVMGTFVPIYIIAAVIIGYFLVKKAFRPLDEIAQTAIKISAGDFSQRIGISTNDEIGVLSSAIDDMLGLIQSTLQKEKQFASNASHELRTPLAVIMAHAEEALYGSKTEEEYRKALYMIYSQSKEMSEMVARFLNYARNKEKTVHLEKTNLSATIESVIDEMRVVHPNFEIVGNVQSNVSMMADQMLMARLVMNLLDNAIKHGRPDGRAVVTLIDYKNGILIKVEDNGKGIAKRDLDNIFKRRYTSLGNDAGHGLGLSLVKWIVNMHGGTITARSKPGHGCTIEIRFSIQKYGVS